MKEEHNQRSRSRIVVPLDESKFAESAIPVALSMARALDADVELVSVFDLPKMLVTAGIEAFSSSPSIATQGLEQYLDGLVEEIAAEADVSVTRTILQDGVVQSLVRHAEDARVALIVMATHGRGPLQWAWLGSVTDRVVRHVHVPVVVVRPKETGSVGISEPRGFGRILVPLDGSPFAERSLEWALRVGRPANASYDLLRVVPHTLPHSQPFLKEAMETAEECAEKLAEEPRRYLSRIADRLRDEGLSVRTEILVDVPASTGILDYAKRHSIDLIAIATHGLGGFWRLMLGSVVDKVLRAAEVPVLLVRPSPEDVAGGGASSAE